MDTLEVIRTKRSVRRFADRPVPERAGHPAQPGFLRVRLRPPERRPGRRGAGIAGGLRLRRGDLPAQHLHPSRRPGPAGEINRKKKEQRVLDWHAMIDYI